MAGKQTKQGSKLRVRVGIIGVGGMGTGHGNSMRRVREMKLTAVCDIDPATAEARGKQFKVPHFTSHRALIKAKLCDAVIIATPHPPRPTIAVACMRAGLHVLSEKPLSENISTAEKMARAAKEHKVAFAVMFQRRFEPAIQKAFEIVRSGALGKVMRATMISPEYRSQAYYDSGGWRATWKGEGGGVMMNQSPHIMDIFVNLAGMPTSVRGNCATKLHHIEVEDCAEATLTYADGAAGYFYCSTNEPGPGQLIEIYGDKGKLTFSDGALRYIKYEVPVSKFTQKNKEMWGRPPQKEVNLRIAKNTSGHFSVMRNFARHILNGEKLVTPGESGLPSLELANAIMLSSFTGEDVKLPISRRKYNAFLKQLREKSTFQKLARTERTTDPQFGV